MALTSAQRRHLRGLAHPLKPAVLVGGARYTEALLAEVDRALKDHELIKLKLLDGDKEEMAAGRLLFAERLQAEWVQSIGHTLVLFRRNPTRPKLDPLPGEDFPRGKKAGG